MTLMAQVTIENTTSTATGFDVPLVGCIFSLRPFLLGTGLSSLTPTIPCYGSPIVIFKSSSLNLYQLTLRHMISPDLFPRIPSQCQITAAQKQPTAKHYLFLQKIHRKHTEKGLS